MPVWLPEFGGPADLDDPTHRALFLLLGHQSEREVLRARRRTTRAMCTQAQEQGRHLGGRPSYGYRLVDAGPHPNRIHAQWGRRLHRLDPDPVTAPHVRWIFARRLAGDSAAGIARALNERNVPSPAAHDPGRNRHRIGTVWTLRTVAEILANPRYTGRQVWNRQRTDHHETVPGDKRTSLGTTRAWNPRSEWVISQRPAHPALVDEADFLAVQKVTAIAAPKGQAARTYLLTGLLICAVCGRRLEPHWVHGRAGYRCRHGRSSAQPRGQRVRNVYWAERRIIDGMLYRLGYAGEVPLLADAGDLIAYLRTRRMVIVCGPDTLDLEPVDQGKEVTPPPGRHHHRPLPLPRLSPNDRPGVIRCPDLRDHRRRGRPRPPGHGSGVPQRSDGTGGNDTGRRRAAAGSALNAGARRRRTCPVHRHDQLSVNPCSATAPATAGTVGLDLNLRPLVTNRDDPGLVIDCRNLALSCGNAT